MTEAMTIRPLTAADAAALLRFYLELPPSIVHWFDPFPQPDATKIGQHLAEVAAGNAISLGLCAAGAILGHAFIRTVNTSSPSFGIGLAETLVGSGWGRRLMTPVIAEADRRQLPRVTLSVFKDNLRARRLYENFGFVVTGEWKCRAPGDSLAMERLPGGGPGNGMRNAFLQLLAGRKTGRTVWTADITYWIAGQKQRGLANPAWDTPEGFLQLHRELGILTYYDYSKFLAAAVRFDRTVSETWTREGLRQRHSLATPLGELVEEHIDMPDSACTGCIRHMVQTRQDLDVLLYALEHRQLLPANLDDYFERFAAWAPFDSFPPLGLPRSPLASFCYEWAGVQNAVYLLADHEDKVRRILALMEEQEKPVLDALCRLAPPLVHFIDNLDSENLTGLYDEFLGPTHRRRLDRLHAAGIRAVVHMDGAVRGLLPKLAAAGFDAVESLTPKPAGDVTVEEMKRLAEGAKVILWGGVPGAMFAPPYTWDDMRRHVQGVLDVWHTIPFVLGVADQVPPDGDITFCRRIADLVKE